MNSSHDNRETSEYVTERVKKKFFEAKFAEKNMQDLQILLKAFFDFLHARDVTEIDSYLSKYNPDKEEKVFKRLTNEIQRRSEIRFEISELLESLVDQPTSFKTKILLIRRSITDYESSYTEFNQRQGKYTKTQPPSELSSIPKQLTEMINSLGLTQTATTSTTRDTMTPPRGKYEDDGVTGVPESKVSPKIQEQQWPTTRRMPTGKIKPQNILPKGVPLPEDDWMDSPVSRHAAFVKAIDSYVVNRWNRALVNIKEPEETLNIIGLNSVDKIALDVLPNSEKGEIPIPSQFSKNYDHWYSMFTGYDAKDKIRGALKIRRLLTEDLTGTARKEIFTSITRSELGAIMASDLGKIFDQFKDEWPKELKDKMEATEEKQRINVETRSQK